MSSTQVGSQTATDPVSAGTTDMKLEVVVIPVSDVDRAKEFYGGLGWRLDADFAAGDDFRIVQFTPPGSGCSIQFGTNLTSAAPGSAQGLYLIVSDIEAARDELIGARRRGQRGVPRGEARRPVPRRGRERPRQRRVARAAATARSPRSAIRTATAGCLQEITTRLPGRIDPAATAFASAGDLAQALRRAAAAHGEHEKRIGEADANWPDWYAEYMVREQAGEELPT